MRAPEPDVPLYWSSAGDILSRDAEVGARPLGLEAALRLHRFHRAELDAAAQADERGARDFHRARDRELAAAIAAACAWRRAARLA